MEVEDNFLRKVREMAINPVETVPLLSKNLRGYVPDGHQTGIANSKYPAGVNQFIEIKIIHSGAVQYSTAGRMSEIILRDQRQSTVFKAKLGVYTSLTSSRRIGIISVQLTAAEDL